MKTRVPDQIYLKRIAALHGQPGHSHSYNEGGDVHSDFISGKLVAQADYRADTFGYYLFDDPTADAPAAAAAEIRWVQAAPEAAGDAISRVSEAQRWFGWDDDGHAYCAAEYGGNASGVVAAAKADGEAVVVYREDAAYVRVAWLKLRFPAATAALAAVGLTFE